MARLAGGGDPRLPRTEVRWAERVAASRSCSSGRSSGSCCWYPVGRPRTPARELHGQHVRHADRPARRAGRRLRRGHGGDPHVPGAIRDRHGRGRRPVSGTSSRRTGSGHVPGRGRRAPRNGSTDRDVRSPSDPRTSRPEGQAGLPTPRLTCSFHAPIAGDGIHEARGGGRNHADRIGWHEIVAVGDGATLGPIGRPDRESERRAPRVPADGSTSDVRTASVAFRAAAPALAASPTPTGGASAGRRHPRLLRGAGPVGRANSAGCSRRAFGVGAVHALAPGHGSR